jgi:hypothetical protein
MSKSPVVQCPHCGKQVVWNANSRFRPFCSERCKLIDLGQWASENYRLPDANPTATDPYDDLSGHA